MAVFKVNMADDGGVSGISRQSGTAFGTAFNSAVSPVTQAIAPAHDAPGRDFSVDAGM